MINLIRRFIYFIYSIHNFIELKRKKVVIGNKLRINGKIYIHGHGTIEIGDNCIVTSSASYNSTSGDIATHFNTMDEGVLIIGNNVGISNSAITARLNVTIEDNVLIGSGCIISDTDHHSIEYAERIRDDANIVARNILIKEGVFIGTRVILMKGVTIGKHSVIGAGSVVTRNIPDNEIWAGNPARFIRKLNT